MVTSWTRRNLFPCPILSLITVSLVLTLGCDGLTVIGVTPGNAANIADARAVIEAGGVPNPRAITVEGFVADHDLTAPTPSGANTLFTTASLGWNQDFDELTPLITIQLGLGTTFTQQTFHRRALNVGLVIDATASMNQALDARTGTSRLEAVLIAVDRVLAQLDSPDLVSLIVFTSRSATLVEGVPGDEALTVKEALDGLFAGGSSPLTDAMQDAYETVRQFRSAARMDRLLVFTDAQLSAGSGPANDLISLMETYAADDIGATIFAVGTDFGEGLGDQISQVRGGNLVYLNDYAGIVEAFDAQFDSLVTPVATDVIISTSIPFTLDMVDAFGVPQNDGGLTHTIELNLPTLFLNTVKSLGAMFIRVRPGALVDLAKTTDVGTVSLAYKDDAGQPVSATAHLSLPAGMKRNASPPFFENDLVHRGILLVNTALALKHACEDAYGLPLTANPTFVGALNSQGVAQATQRLQDFLPYFDQLAAGLADGGSDTSRGLSDERALTAKLLTNLGP